MRIKTLATAIIVAAGLSAAPTVSAAAPSPDRLDQTQVEELLGQPAKSMQELQQQIDLHLKLAPGGRQTAPNEVSYGNGRFVVTYALPGVQPQASPDCPSGWFCFYDHTSWGYPRGKLSDCGWQDLDGFGWSDRTESIDNSTGSRVDYIQHQDFGNPANGHRFDFVLFSSPAHSASSTVSSPNQADHVNRRC